MRNLLIILIMIMQAASARSMQVTSTRSMQSCSRAFADPRNDTYLEPAAGNLLKLTTATLGVLTGLAAATVAAGPAIAWFGAVASVPPAVEGAIVFTRTSEFFKQAKQDLLVFSLIQSARIFVRNGRNPHAKIFRDFCVQGQMRAHSMSDEAASKFCQGPEGEQLAGRLLDLDGDSKLCRWLDRGNLEPLLVWFKGPGEIFDLTAETGETDDAIGPLPGPLLDPLLDPFLDRFTVDNSTLDNSTDTLPN